MKVVVDANALFSFFKRESRVIVEELKTKQGLETNYEVLEAINDEPNLIDKAKPKLDLLLFILENYKGLRSIP